MSQATRERVSSAPRALQRVPGELWRPLQADRKLALRFATAVATGVHEPAAQAASKARLVGPGGGDGWDVAGRVTRTLLARLMPYDSWTVSEVLQAAVTGRLDSRFQSTPHHVDRVVRELWRSLPSARTVDQAVWNANLAAALIGLNARAALFAQQLDALLDAIHEFAGISSETAVLSELRFEEALQSNPDLKALLEACRNAYGAELEGVLSQPQTPESDRMDPLTRALIERGAQLAEVGRPQAEAVSDAVATNAKLDPSRVSDHEIHLIAGALINAARAETRVPFNWKEIPRLDPSALGQTYPEMPLLHRVDRTADVAVQVARTAHPPAEV